MALTANGVLFLIKTKEESLCEPVLQVRQITVIKNDIIRIVLGDGRYQLQAISKRELKQKFLGNSITAKSIVKVKDWSLNAVNGGSVVVVLNDVELISSHPDFIGGKLESIETKRGAQPVPPAYMQPLQSIAKETYWGIRDLNMSSKGWVLRAKVVSKGQIKEWKNDKSAGKLFNAVLMDSSKDEIQITFFKEAVDKFYFTLEQGKIFSFSNGVVKMSNPRFCSVANEFQITFGTEATIIQLEDDGSVGDITVNVIAIEAVANKPVNSLVDICGVISDVSGIQELTSKKGNRLKKRTITIVDESRCSVNLVMWNEAAEETKFERAQLVMIKSAKVTHFSGVTLAVDSNITVFISNIHPQTAKRLMDWYAKNQYAQVLSLSFASNNDNAPLPLSLISAIKQEWEFKDSGSATKKVLGMISFIKKTEFSNIAYTACKSATCKKKVTMTNADVYYCETCQQHFEQCNYRYMLNVKIHDGSDSMWVSVFDEQATKLLGLAASDLKQRVDDDSAYLETVGDVSLYKQWVVRLRVNIGDTLNRPRMRCTVNSLTEPDDNLLLDFLAYFKERSGAL